MFVQYMLTNSSIPKDQRAVDTRFGDKASEKLEAHVRSSTPDQVYCRGSLVTRLYRVQL